MRELSLQEHDQVNGGFAQIFGFAAVGGGISLAQELLDNRPGVQWGNVATGAIIGATGGWFGAGLAARGAATIVVRAGELVGGAHGAAIGTVVNAATGGIRNPQEAKLDDETKPQTEEDTRN